MRGSVPTCFWQSIVIQRHRDSALHTLWYLLFNLALSWFHSEPSPGIVACTAFPLLVSFRHFICNSVLSLHSFCLSLELSFKISFQIHYWTFSWVPGAWSDHMDTEHWSSVNSVSLGEVPTILIQLVSHRGAGTEEVSGRSTQRQNFNYTLSLNAYHLVNHKTTSPQSQQLHSVGTGFKAACRLDFSPTGQALCCRHSLHKYEGSPKCLLCAEFLQVLCMETGFLRQPSNSDK